MSSESLLGMAQWESMWLAWARPQGQHWLQLTDEQNWIITILQYQNIYALSTNSSYYHRKVTNMRCLFREPDPSPCHTHCDTVKLKLSNWSSIQSSAVPYSFYDGKSSSGTGQFSSTKDFRF